MTFSSCLRVEFQTNSQPRIAAKPGLSCPRLNYGRITVTVCSTPVLDPTMSHQTSVVRVALTWLTAYPSLTTSSTAFGFRSITRSSTLAAGSGWRRPCSQPSNVRTGMPKRRENSREVFATLFRIAFTRSAVSDGTLRTGSATSPRFQAAASRNPSNSASPNGVSCSVLAIEHLRDQGERRLLFRGAHVFLFRLRVSKQHHRDILG